MAPGPPLGPAPHGSHGSHASADPVHTVRSGDGPRRTRPADAGRGFLMGMAEAVPGVSGGTIALVLGIYHRFIAALAAIDRTLLQRLAGAGSREGRTRLWHQVQRADLPFLAVLAVGMAAGFLVVIQGVGWLLENHPVPLMALFLGLVLASARIPWQAVGRRGPAIWVALAGGIALAAIAAQMPAFATAPPAWFLVVAGFLALAIMLLPGVSGASLLAILGVYEGLVHSVLAVDIPVILLFGAGAVLGLLVASRAIQALLRRHPDPTHAALTGLMIGSLVRLWPWRDVPGFTTGDPALPDALGVQAAIVVAAAVLGAGMSWGVEALGRGRPDVADRA